MHLFVLGFLLGSGLVLAIQTLKQLATRCTATRRANFQAAVNAEVNRRMNEGNGWDWAQPNHDKTFVPIKHP